MNSNYSAIITALNNDVKKIRNDFIDDNKLESIPIDDKIYEFMDLITNEITVLNTNVSTYIDTIHTEVLSELSDVDTRLSVNGTSTKAL